MVSRLSDDGQQRNPAAKLTSILDERLQHRIRLHVGAKSEAGVKQPFRGAIKISGQK